MSSFRFLAAALFALCASTTSAASNMVPNYEVKLLMNPTSVLGPDNKLKPTVLSTFAMPTSVTKMNVQYLDTNARDIYNAGWSPRIRKMEDEDDFELTYKKRYPVTNGDIDGALTTAKGEGFDISATIYEAQIEWGYQSKTLSISREKTASDSGFSVMNLPGQSASQDMLISEVPDKFNDYLGDNWGTDTLSVSRIFGPVLAKRSIGTWSGLKVRSYPLTRMHKKAGLSTNKHSSTSRCGRSKMRLEPASSILLKHLSRQIAAPRHRVSMMSLLVSCRQRGGFLHRTH
jgi:hypothetical protein